MNMVLNYLVVLPIITINRLVLGFEQCAVAFYNYNYLLFVQVLEKPRVPKFISEQFVVLF